LPNANCQLPIEKIELRIFQNRQPAIANGNEVKRYVDAEES
jgi:hypothetical protein